MPVANDGPAGLIVGAGPTGLTLALGLARRSIPFRIVDQEPGPVRESRALVVQPRTMEVLEDLGVAGALREQAIPLEEARFSVGGGDPVVFRVAGMGGPWGQPFTIPQDETERVLIEALTDAGVEVERETELVELDDPTAPQVMLAGPDGPRRLEPAWVAGCDGAHSTVREALSLPFEGLAYPERFVVADADLDTSLGGHGLNAWLHPAGLLLVVPLRRPGHHRVIATLRPEQTPDRPVDEAPRRDELQRLVDERADVPITLDEPRWVSVFRVHCRGAPTYRVQRVLLAGDAAHIHSPAGGQGMNTGIQDAHNLAWKLARVAEGTSEPSLLDSYDAERRPVGERLLATTDRAFRFLAASSRASRLLRRIVRRGLAMERVQDRVRRFVSQRHIRYSQSPALGPDEASSGLLPWRSGGLRVGEQVPSVLVERGAERVDLVRLVARWPGHVVLVLQGTQDPAPLDEVRPLVEALASDRLDPTVAVALAEPEEPGGLDAAVLRDPDGHLHEAFGRRTAGYEVIRPDGHLGARSATLSTGTIDAYREQLA